MATLVKDSRGRSRYYICCYTAADGRRLKKSTKQTDRARALEVCLALERAEGMAARGTLTETHARALIGEILERTSGDTLPFYGQRRGDEGRSANWQKALPLRLD